MKPFRAPDPQRDKTLKRLLCEERGLTLVEELVTLAIIGLGITILVAMITTGAIGVRQVDDRVIAQSLSGSQLELIKDANYEPDPTASPYPAVSPPPEYQITVQVEYWDAANDTFTTTVRNDGLQKITVTVTSDGKTLSQTAELKVDR